MRSLLTKPPEEGLVKPLPTRKPIDGHYHLTMTCSSVTPMSGEAEGTHMRPLGCHGSIDVFMVSKAQALRKAAQCGWIYTENGIWAYCPFCAPTSQNGKLRGARSRRRSP